MQNFFEGFAVGTALPVVIISLAFLAELVRGL